MWQTERDTQLAHFFLEQLAQRLEQLQVQGLRQTAHVVAALDGLALLALAGRFDHVRVDGALRQPLRIGQLVGFLLEHLENLATDH